MMPSNCALNFGTYAVPVLKAPANTNQASLALWTDFMVRVTFQIVGTGTTNGSIQIQGSDDQSVGLPANQFQPTNWNNVGASVAVVGTTPSITPEIETCYEYMRLVFTDASGGAATGTISARAKGIALGG